MFTTRTRTGTMILRLLWVYVLLFLALLALLYPSTHQCDIHYGGECMDVSDIYYPEEG